MTVDTDAPAGRDLDGRRPKRGARPTDDRSYDQRQRRRDIQDFDDEHPTPIAPLAGLIGRTRFVVLLAVVSVIMVSIALFIVGSGMAVQGVWHALVAVARGDLAATSITVNLLEVVSVLLKAVVFYLIGVGFYSLFIAPLNLTAALGIRSFNDLEIKVVSVVVVILSVTYLEHFIRWEQAVETLLFGVSLAVVVAALVLFQMHSHRAAREDEHTDAPMRVRAQRELFHADHEEREVEPTEEIAQERPDASRSRA
jgi:uncharacterized membrane protein YqhA